MGGTSTDVSLVEGGAAETTRQTKVGYYRVPARAADIHSVGAGGGSIAYLKLAGALQVGPRERRRRPRPGVLRARRRPSRRSPTPTSSWVVCRRRSKLGGRLELDVGRPRTTPWRPSPRSVGIGRGGRPGDHRHRQREHARRAARGERRARLRPARVRPRRLRRCRADARQRAGGRDRRVSRCIIPPGPGVMSAFGFLAADVQNEFAETYLEAEDDVDGDGRRGRGRRRSKRRPASGWVPRASTRPTTPSSTTPTAATTDRTSRCRSR